MIEIVMFMTQKAQCGEGFVCAYVNWKQSGYKRAQDLLKIANAYTGIDLNMPKAQDVDDILIMLEKLGYINGYEY